MDTRTSTSVALVLLSFAIVGASPAFSAPTDDHPNVKIIELQQTEAVLRETYRKGNRMFLPRMVMLSADGRVLYGGPGMPNDLRQRLHKAYDAGKPLDVPITLQSILDETQRSDGSKLQPSDLPKADVYMVDYWATWCAPCRMMSRDLSSIMGRWSDKQFVWLKIESDPEKLPPLH